MNLTKIAIPCAAAAALAAASQQTALASSHGEAPAIAEDRFVDNTDVYAFISPNDSDNLVIVANYVPLLLPYSGPNFFKFSDNAAYDINIDNNGDARTDLVYRFLFKTRVGNGDTFLYNTGIVTSPEDVTLNVKQTYDVLLLDRRGRVQDVIAADVPVAPWNVGDRSFPGGTYEGVARQAVRTTGDGISLFAGPRDEPFFVDLHVFDLLGVGGAPTTDGFNVMSIVMELPIAHVARDGRRPSASDTSRRAVVGVHATASRHRKTVRRRAGADRNRGQFTQVSRLGWPLVNEVVVPLKDKDKFNRSQPKDDVENIGAYILAPEVNTLLSGVLGLPCTPNSAGPRTDLVELLAPFGTDPADLLRIDIREGQTAGDTGFPNGRTLEDDVVKTLLTAICAGGVDVDDLVTGNDLPFLSEFPYLASPHSGSTLLVQQ